MPAAAARPRNPAFVHLRLHTEYSLVDGIVRVPELMQAVADAGMPAVALTDHGNLFAMVKFHREAQKQGIKPLIGADLWWTDGGESRRRAGRGANAARRSTIEGQAGAVARRKTGNETGGVLDSSGRAMVETATFQSHFEGYTLA